MATVADLQAQLEALRASRAAGVRETRADGRVVVYGSDAEMAAAIADLQREILIASGASMVHTVRVASTKGLE
jgi:hypothetical protein